MYQITMAYAYWKANRHDLFSVFDLFYRKHPMNGNFTVFAGLDECLRMIQHFKFTAADISYLESNLGREVDPAFFKWLAQCDTSKVTVYAIAEGTLVEPRLPLIRLEGPLAILQLLETPLLNLVNFATLMATNAARFRICVGKRKNLIEFGLRRAQGPDGGLSASRYSFMGGFDGSANVRAGQLFGIPIRGTHAHAWVQSFASLSDITNPWVVPNGPCSGKSLPWGTGANAAKVDLVKHTVAWRERLGNSFVDTNSAELAAFIAYAIAFPDYFLALVDTYDTLRSGVPNFLLVCVALFDLGHKGIGIRLDSGDLAKLSRESRAAFKALAKELGPAYTWIGDCLITASDDINESSLEKFENAGHQIDSFGVGTNLVTCQKQPALGGVYKLVRLDGIDRIKLSQNFIKVTIPGQKQVYRLYSKNASGKEVRVADYFTFDSETAPVPGQKMIICNPFDDKARFRVTPSRVEPLVNLVMSNGNLRVPLPSLPDIRSFVLAQLEQTGRLTDSATPCKDNIAREKDKANDYPVMASLLVAETLHRLYLKNAAIAKL